MLSNINSINEIDINKFDNHGVIKPGCFGIVYKIQEKRTHNLFAAKILIGDYSNEQFKTMIDREIAILKFVNHPTIIKYFGYSLRDVHNENNVTIITEFAKNGSLSDILEKILSSNGPSNYDNTTRQIILTGISRGMKYLHDLNIIHRDLKPDNILLDENFRPLITDFGLSKFYQGSYSNIQSQIVGTSIYMAPEVHSGINYDSKADVYSFGILMYEVVMDAVPYPKLKNHEIGINEFKDKVVNHNYRPEFKYHVKESIKTLIEKCWSADPKERPTFSEIYDMLSSKDDGTYLLDDVDIDEFNLYVEDINKASTPIDELINKMEKIEKEKNKLQNYSEQLENENNEIKDIADKLLNENNKLIETCQHFNDEVNKKSAFLSGNKMQHALYTILSEIIVFIFINSFYFEINYYYVFLIASQLFICFSLFYEYKASYYSNYKTINCRYHLLYLAIFVINIIIHTFALKPKNDDDAFNALYLLQIVLYIIVMNTKESFLLITQFSFFANAFWHFSAQKAINYFIAILNILQYIFYLLEKNVYNLIFILEAIVITCNYSQLKEIIYPIAFIQIILFLFTNVKCLYLAPILLLAIGLFIIKALYDLVKSDKASSGFIAAALLYGFNTIVLIATCIYKMFFCC
ncbi:hypothetical protein M9Y10_030258 [Tritrichomonas musculus]|uniref:Protein kinase domain-containing protein n=1 Tax=Tritrichomonas musculus TaxID=1915356 RepID=A0ABR2KPG2_9EUKA